MEKLSNIVISDVKEGKSGTESWGVWRAWSVWFVGMEPKFDYFERDNVVPFPGMQVVLAEYTVEQTGQYTNYKLKKLVPAQIAGPPVIGPPVQARKPSPLAPAVVDYEKEKRLTMCTSYAKDLMVQLISAEGCLYKEKGFSVLIELVAKGGKLLAKRLGERLEVVLEPEVLPEPVKPIPAIPGPPVLMPEVVVSPEMVEAATEILVPPVVLPTPKGSTPNDDIPF